jgi:hypothetical protein
MNGADTSHLHDEGALQRGNKRCEAILLLVYL